MWAVLTLDGIILMVELSWQNNLAKVVAAITAAGILFITIAIVVAWAWPSSENGGEPGFLKNAGAPVVCIAMAAFLLLIAGILHEKDMLHDRLPTCTGKKLGVGALVVIMLVPIFHLGFAISVFLFMIIALSMRPTLSMRVRSIAVCDALLCFAVVEVMRQAGPMGEYGVARALLALYAAFFITMLPGVTFLASFLFLPKLSRLACYGYAAAALHAAGITLLSAGRLLNESIDGDSKNYGEQRCIKSIAVSPLGLFLELIQNASVTPDAYRGPVNTSPCYNPAAALSASGIIVTPLCDKIGFEVITLFLMIGAYILVWVLFVYLCFVHTSEARVVPEGSDGKKKKKGLDVCFAFGKNAGRLICFAALLVGAIFLSVLAAVVLPCKSDPSTSQEVTPQGVLSNTTLTSTVTTTTSTTSTIAALNIVNGTNGTNATSTTLGAPIVNIGFAVECPDDFPTISPSAAHVSLSAPMTGCRCGEDGIRGVEAWFVVPVDQVSATYCELGTWASLAVGLSLYCFHGFAYSVAAEQAEKHSAKERDIAHKAKMWRHHQLVLAGKPKKVEEKREPSALELAIFKPAPRELAPAPIAELGYGRVFDV